MKADTETTNPDLSQTAMLGVLDSIESLLNEKEQLAIDASRFAKADQLTAVNNASQSEPGTIAQVDYDTIPEIPVLKDVVSTGSIEIMDPLRSRVEMAHLSARKGPADSGGQELPTSKASHTVVPGDSAYFTDRLQEEVDKVVDEVMAEHAQKLLDRLRAKLRERVAYLLIHSREDALRK